MRQKRQATETHNRQGQGMLALIAKNPQGTAFYTFALMSLVLVLAIFTPYPADDFLRHAKYLDYKPLGGYAYMFPGSGWSDFPGSPWIGFDYIAGLALATFGHHMTIKILTIAFAVITFITMTKAMKFPMGESKPMAMPVFFAMSLITINIGRLTSIRPAILLAILLLMGLNGRRAISGFILGTLSALIHHLFFFYTLPLTIAHYFKGGRKFSYGLAAATICGIAAWNILTGGKAAIYEYNLVMLPMQAKKLAPMEAMFTPPVIMSNFGLFIVCTFFAIALARNRHINFYTILIALTAPYAIQIRFFTDITMPLMLIYIHNNLDAVQENFHRYAKVLGAATVLLSAGLLYASIEAAHIRLPMKLTQGIRIPKGATVYVDPSTNLTYPLIFWNEQPIHVIPSPEVRTDSDDTKTITAKILYLNAIPQDFCYYAAKNNITYAITMLPPRTNCFILVKSANLGTKTIDIWQVSPYPIGPIPPQPEFLPSMK